MERTPHSELRVEAVAHDRCRFRLTLCYRQLRSHSCRRSELVFAAERHQHRSRSDRAVESFDQALLAAAVQVCQQLLFRLRLHENVSQLAGRLLYSLWISSESFCKLLRSVCVQEISAEIEDAFFSPVHPDSVRVGHLCDRSGLEVFLSCILYEFLLFVGIDHDCHSFLRLRDRKLCAVEAVVLLRHEIEVDLETVGQLADGYRHTAGTEVIAALYQCSDFFSPEKSLYISLYRRISLLDFCSALQYRFFRVFLGRACSSAASVAACPAADQDYNVALLRCFSYHVIRRCSSDYRSDLHSFGNVVVVVNFVDEACRKSDLVAVRAVSVSGFCRYLSLRKLAAQRVFYRRPRICSTCHSHCLIHIDSA